MKNKNTTKTKKCGKCPTKRFHDMLNRAIAEVLDACEAAGMAPAEAIRLVGDQLVIAAAAMVQVIRIDLPEKAKSATEAKRGV